MSDGNIECDLRWMRWQSNVGTIRMARYLKNYIIFKKMLIRISFKNTSNKPYTLDYVI